MSTMVVFRGRRKCPGGKCPASVPVVVLNEPRKHAGRASRFNLARWFTGPAAASAAGSAAEERWSTGERRGCVT